MPLKYFPYFLDMKALLAEMSLKATSGGSAIDKHLLEKSAELMATPPLGGGYGAALTGNPAMPEFYFPFYDPHNPLAAAQQAFMHPALFAGGMLDPAAMLLGGAAPPSGSSASSSSSNSRSSKSKLNKHSNKGGAKVKGVTGKLC